MNTWTVMFLINHTSFQCQGDLVIKEMILQPGGLGSGPSDSNLLKSPFTNNVRYCADIIAWHPQMGRQLKLWDLIIYHCSYHKWEMYPLQKLNTLSGFLAYLHLAKQSVLMSVSRKNVKYIVSHTQSWFPLLCVVLNWTPFLILTSIRILHRAVLMCM